jgi:5-methylcytosine-specific restriction endonuclease McrA
MTNRIHWTLLLNATFEPLMVISWKKAVVMVILDKVEVVEEYERILRGVSFALRLPAVIRLTRHVRRKTPLVKSRQTLRSRQGPGVSTAGFLNRKTHL